MSKNTEPTVNVVLAEVLRTKNPRWKSMSAEQTGVLTKSGCRLDILLPGDAPVAIETEFMPARTVERDAQGRLDEILEGSRQRIEQAVALRMPESLRACPQAGLREAVAGSEYTYCLWTMPIDEHPSRWPSDGWITGDVDALADLLENAGLSERVVADSLDALEAGVGAAATMLRKKTQGRPDINQDIASKLHQEDGMQTSKMAMAIVANALTFQTMISGAHQIRNIDQMRLASGAVSKPKVLEEWRRILDEVNYWPIFHIAIQILLPVPDGLASKILGGLANTAQALAANGVTRSHDLHGRLFQRLISDRKFLATFYTLPPSATLLAELAVGSLEIPDWGDAEAVKKLRVADLACGTGTLLAAAYQAVLSRFRRAGGDDSEIHRAMVEQALVAADIMPAATHLTTSMLSSMHPAQIFRETQVHTLPYGSADKEDGELPYIGALDFIDHEHGMDTLKQGVGLRRAEGHGPDRTVGHEELASGRFALKDLSMDLVIMNPPFTRPTNHESTDVPVPSFAGFATKEEEQKAMSERLAALRKSLKSPAGDGKAGLASNFIDLADVKLREEGKEGVLALILPMAFAQGKAWANSRDKLEREYTDIRIVSISASKARDKAFSSDTGMGEVLVLARKRRAVQPGQAKDPVAWITLRRRPASAMDAIEVARGIGKSLRTGARFARVEVGADLVGTVLRSGMRHGGFAAVADWALAETAIALESCLLDLPRLKGPMPIKMTNLDSLGRRGFLHRDINGMNGSQPRGPFDTNPLSPGTPTYPCLWRHDAKKERHLIVPPDREATVRLGMEERAIQVWERATRLHFNQDFRLNSQSLAACLTAESAIGGPAWPNYQLDSPEGEEAMALWANTTLGLLLFWWSGGTQQAGRARLTISRLPEMYVLDIRQLSDQQKQGAKRLFEEFQERAFLPANEAYRDEVRKDLDRALLVDLLGFPETIMESLDLLRRKWCAEPTVHGGKETKIQEDD